MEDARGVGDNSSEYGEDAGLGTEESVATVAAKTARVAELAKEQFIREVVVASLESQLKNAVIRLEDVSKRELPLLLQDLNVAKLPLANGAEVKLKKKVVASVLKEHEPEFIAWLVKKGFGALPKRKVTVEFPMGSFKKAGQLLGYLKRWYKEFIFTDNESVHASTLNAWAKEVTEKNHAALASGGKLLELPEILKLTDLLESQIVIPKGKQVEWK